MGKISAPLSAETSVLLEKSPEFFQAVVDNYEKTKLNLLGGADDARTEVEKLANGDIKITFIYPLDDDTDPKNGRLYMKDTFVFDPWEKDFRADKYTREFQRNPNVPDLDGKWKNYEALYNGAAKPKDDEIRTFAFIIARSFSRPITPALFAKLKTQQEFFTHLGERLSAKSLTINFQDPRNHYSIIHKGLEDEIVFSFIAEDDNTDAQGKVIREKKAGSVFLQERFTVMSNTGDFWRHKEDWGVAMDTPNEAYWKGLAKDLREGGKPSKDEAKAFLKVFMPDILNKPIDPGNEKAEDVPLVPPSGGYKPFTPAVFERLQQGALARYTEVARKDLPDEFFANLKEAGDYFQPLKEALGSEYSLDLGNPPLSVNVGVSGSRTSVDYKFSFKSASSGKALEYSERWVYEGNQLKEVQRFVEGPDGAALQAIRDKIKDKKFMEPGDPKAGIMHGLTAFVAPHVSTFGGGKKLLDDPELKIPPEARTGLKALRDIETAVTPLLYLPTVDANFRGQFLMTLGALQYGNDKLADMGMMALKQYAKENLAKTKDVDQMMRIQEFAKMGEIIYAMMREQDLGKARKLAESLQSPQIRHAMLTPVAHLESRARLVEGLDVMQTVALDLVAKNHHDSKAWIYTGPKVDKEGESKAVQSLFQKAQTKALESKAKDPLSVLNELSDLNDAEKAVRSKLQGDRLIDQVNCIAQEKDRRIQGNSYFLLAKGALFEQGLMSSARSVAEMVAFTKMPKTAALESLSLVEQIGMERLANQKKSTIAGMQAAQSSMPMFMQIAGSALEQNPAITAPELVKGLGGFIQSRISDLPSVPDEAERAKFQAQLLSLQSLHQKISTDPVYQKLLQASTGAKPEERYAQYSKVLKEVADPEVQKMAEQIPDLMKGIKAQMQSESADLPGALEGLLLVSALEGKRLGDQQKQLMTAGLAYKSLIAKATPFALSRPNEGALALIKLVDEKNLNPDEKVARDLLLADSFVATVSQVAAKTKIEDRVTAYGDLIKNKDFEKQGLQLSMAWMANQAQQGKFPELPKNVKTEQDLIPHQKFANDVGEFLAMTEGRGSTATKISYGTPRFLDELAKPTTLVAMVAAGGIGAFSEFQVLRGFSALRPIGSMSTMGKIGVGLTAATISIGVEATAFSTVHRLGESAIYSSEGQEIGGKAFWKEVGSSALLFGGMRAGHTVVGSFSQYVMAPGKKGFGWAGGLVEGEAGAAMSVTPTGKVLTRPTAPNGVPQLTVAGERVTALLNHTAGIGAMWGTGYLARGLHLQEGSSQDAKGHLVDAFLGYLNATMGYNIANRGTGFAFQKGVGTLKMTSEAIKADGKAPAAKPEILKGDTKLLDLNQLPDLRMLDLASGGSKNYRLTPEKATGIDAFLFGVKGGKSVKIKVDQDGKIFILDTRGVEAKVEPAKPEEAKPDEAKADEAKAGEPKADEPAAPADPATATADPLQIQTPEGVKTVTPGEWTELGMGNTLSVGGKSVALSMPKTSPIHAPLAKLSRERQLSLAKNVGRAKDPADLIKRLEGVHYEGSGDVLTAVSMVFNGKMPLHQLPAELGLRAKVRALLDAEVTRMEKEGYALDELAQALKVQNAQWSPVELRYQAGRQMEIFNARVAGAESFQALIAQVINSPFRTIDGVRPEELLMHLQIGGLQEAKLQAELDLTKAQEKLKALQHNAGENRGELLKTRNPAKKKELKDLIAEYEKRIDEQHEAVAEAKANAKAIGDLVEGVTKDPSVSKDLAPEALVEQLPATGGLRQKARDLLDSKAYEDRIASRSKDKPSEEDKHEMDAEQQVIKLVKKNIFYQLGDDFILAQKLLRHSIDNGTPQAKNLLRKATPAEKEILLATYFGTRTQRDVVNVAKAFEALGVMGQTGPGARIQLNYEVSGDTLKANLVFSARETKDTKSPGQDFQLMVLNPEGRDPQDVLPTGKDLKRAVKQAKRYAKEGYPEKLGETPLYNPTSQAFRQWVVGEKGASLIHVRLDADGKPEKIIIRSALEKPVGHDKKDIKLDTAELEAAAKALDIPIETETVSYAKLLSEMPFEVNPLTRFQKFSRWTSQLDIPLPKPVKKVVDLSKDAAALIISIMPKKKPAMPESDKPKGKDGGDKPEPPKGDAAPDSKKGKKADAAPDSKDGKADAKGPDSKVPPTVDEPVPPTVDEPVPPTVSDPIPDSEPKPEAAKAAEPSKPAETSMLQGLSTFFSIENSPRLQSWLASVKEYFGLALARFMPKPKAALEAERVEAIHDSVENNLRAQAQELMRNFDPNKDTGARVRQKVSGELRIDLDTGKVLGKGEKAKREHKFGYFANYKDGTIEFKAGEKALIEKKAAKEKDPTRKAVLEGLAKVDGQPMQLKLKPEALIGGIDPRSSDTKMIVPVKVEMELRNKKGEAVGKVHLVAGGQEGEYKVKLENGTIVSVKTSKGGEARDHHQDAFLIATAKVKVNGEATEVLYVVPIDGAGGSSAGELSSSAMAQGIQAKIAEATLEGRVALPHELWAAGHAAVKKQTQLYGPFPKSMPPTGSGLIQVFVGDQVLMASAGDAMGTLSAKGVKGKHRTLGTTHMDNAGPSVIINGINDNNPHLWVATVKKGYRANGASDGGWESVATNGYKANTMDNGMLLGDPKRVGELKPEVSQDLMRPFNLMLDATAGREDAAFRFHDLALENNKLPGQEHEVVLGQGIKVRLASEAADDNIVFTDVQIGDVKPLKKPLEIPSEYRELLPVEKASRPSDPPARPEADTLPEVEPPPVAGTAPQAEGVPPTVGEKPPATVDEPTLLGGVAPTVGEPKVEPVPPTVDDSALAGVSPLAASTGGEPAVKVEPVPPTVTDPALQGAQPEPAARKVEAPVEFPKAAKTLISEGVEAPPARVVPPPPPDAKPSKLPPPPRRASTEGKLPPPIPGVAPEIAAIHAKVHGAVQEVARVESGKPEFTVTLDLRQITGSEDLKGQTLEVKFCLDPKENKLSLDPNTKELLAAVKVDEKNPKLLAVIDGVSGLDGTSLPAAAPKAPPVKVVDPIEAYLTRMADSEAPTPVRGMEDGLLVIVFPQDSSRIRFGKAEGADQPLVFDAASHPHVMKIFDPTIADKHAEISITGDQAYLTSWSAGETKVQGADGSEIKLEPFKKMSIVVGQKFWLGGRGFVFRGRQ